MPERADSLVTRLLYKVVWYDHGAYDIFDREHGDKVGYVLGTFNGWDAFSLVPQRRYLGEWKLRREAANAVWEARKP